MICSYKFLTIDDTSIWGMDRLQRRVNAAIKHPEPVVTLDAPWDTDPTEQFNYINVIYDPDKKLFKMWYVVCGKSCEEYWERGRKTAYATSKDGVHWEKPVMNMVEVRGSKKNNYVLPQMLSLNFNILVDPSDIPSRRYKITFTVESEETRWSQFHSPIGIGYSADGIHWDIPVHVNPIVRGVADDLWGFSYDPDRRKYMLLTRRVPNIPRDISLYESSDLVTWEDRGIVLAAGDEHDSPEMYNLHGIAPFFYEGYWLGLLGTMYFLPGAESFTVFNKPPETWPGKNLGLLDVQLSYSRDGRKWLRPSDRSPVISVGQPDAPDAGIAIPSRNGPIVVNGETWIYYTAMRDRHTAWWQQENKHAGDMRDTSCCMLAKMPEDRWTSLDGDAQGGWFVTHPWGPPLEVFVNAEIAQRGSIAVEIITPYGDPMKGYGLSECIPVSSSGTKQQIKWKNGRPPYDFIKDYVGGVCLKFHVTNAKLFSYTLTLPDPDGQLERDRLNARWCDSIKHRSGNWDRSNTDLPIGDDARQRLIKRMNEARPYESPSP
jgi:hypothetical protein